MDEAGWIIPFPEVTLGLGQRSHASLGTGTDVSKPRLLSPPGFETQKSDTSGQRSEIRSQHSDSGDCQLEGNRNANQVSKGSDRLSKSVCSGDGDFRGEQKVPGRGEVFLNRSNPTFLSLSLYEFAGSMGKTEIRSTLRE